MMSEFDPKILAELDPKHREPITEEIARLNKENDDLLLDNKVIAAETIQQMLGMEQNVLENIYRWDVGPVFFVCAMNELALGPWCCVDDGYLTITLNFLWFTVGVDIPLGIKEDKDE